MWIARVFGDRVPRFLRSQPATTVLWRGKGEEGWCVFPIRTEKGLQATVHKFRTSLKEGAKLANTVEEVLFVETLGFYVQRVEIYRVYGDELIANPCHV